MKNVIVASAVRTPIGSIGGTLKDIKAQDLMRVVLEGAIEKARIGKDQIDEVVCGQAKQSTDAPNVARVATLGAKIPEKLQHTLCIANVRRACRPYSMVCSRSNTGMPTSC
jgi:acetyl-CoA C-acetyltransferase